MSSIYNTSVFNNYNSSNIYGNSLFYNYQQPTNNMMSIFSMLLFTLANRGGLNQSLFSANSGKTPISVDEETVNVTTKSGGDPHFYLADAKSGNVNKVAYDFQGVSNGNYSLLDNSDVSVNARFIDGYSAEAAKLGVSGADVQRVMGDMDLNIKNTGINVVSHNNGKFEIFENGKKIADQTNYKDVQDKLKAKGITLESGKKANAIVSISYGDRNIDMFKSHGGMWLGTNRMTEDKGLNEQTYGALDTDHDGNAKALMDVNQDGKVDDSDNIKYNIKNQLMVNGYGSAAEITDEIEAAIKKDIKAGLAKGAAIKGYSTEHGYSAMQWNEYVGRKAFTVEDKFLQTA